MYCPWNRLLFCSATWISLTNEMYYHYDKKSFTLPNIMTWISSSLVTNYIYYDYDKTLCQLHIVQWNSLVITAHCFTYARDITIFPSPNTPQLLPLPHSASPLPQTSPYITTLTLHNPYYHFTLPHPTSDITLYPSPKTLQNLALPHTVSRTPTTDITQYPNHNTPQPLQSPLTASTPPPQTSPYIPTQTLFSPCHYPKLPHPHHIHQPQHFTTLVITAHCLIHPPPTTDNLLKHRTSILPPPPTPHIIWLSGCHFSPSATRL